MSVRLRNTSRLRFGRLIVLDGIECWELPEYPVVAPADDDLEHFVDTKDHIDALARRYYGSEELWWVIALANDLVLLPIDLVAETTIRIPSPRRVFTEILRKPARHREER